MDDRLRQSMRRYYDERAADYEDAYVRGLGTASIDDPALFQREAARLGSIVARTVSGRVIDLACGTAYWLPHYAARATHVTLIDQSPRMLQETRAKIATVGIGDHCMVREGNVLDTPLDPHGYDTALVGFLLSHLTDEEVATLFARLRHTLAPGGSVLILDSAWSPARAAVNAKVERQVRPLNDGTSFEIYKRYFDAGDIDAWSRSHGVRTTTEHLGAAFLAVTGTFAVTAGS